MIWRCFQGYPLRPELIESTYLLHSATGDPKYLEAGRLFQATLVERNLEKCGYASVADVATGTRPIDEALNLVDSQGHRVVAATETLLTEVSLNVFQNAMRE